MASLAEPSRGGRAAPADHRARRGIGFVDRWIFVFMAGLFLATALAGFVPDSIGLVAAVRSGAEPPLPWILHVHAALMGCWLLLLLAQTILVATKRTAAHRILGLAAIGLVPAMVAAGLLLVPTMYGQVWAAVHKPTPGMPAAARQQAAFVLSILSNLVLFQIRAGILFPVCVVLALRARRRDPATHKRLMILATAIPLAAAIDRMAWLPSTMPTSPLSSDLYLLAWIAPMLAWDLFRVRQVPRAYLIWFGLNLPALAVVHLLWGSAWWSASVPRLLGMAA